MLRYLTFLIIGSFIIASAIFESIDFKYLNNNWHDINTQFDSYLGWKPIPNIHNDNIATNSLGFRSEEIDQGMGQIIILGDSVAFGLKLKDNETVSYYLNEGLRKFNFQVQNLAVSGYGPDQYYLYLKENIGKFKNLKYVFVVICTANDYENIINDVQYGKRKPLFVFKDNELVLSNVPISKFDLRNIFSASKLVSIFSRNGLAKKFFDDCAGHKTLDDTQGRRLMSLLLKKINDLVVEHHARLVYVLSPKKKDLINKSLIYRYFEDLMISSPQYAYINFLDDLKGRQKDVDLIFLRKSHSGLHYAPLGSKILADRMLKYLESNNFQLN